MTPATKLPRPILAWSSPIWTPGPACDRNREGLVGRFQIPEPMPGPAGSNLVGNPTPRDRHEVRDARLHRPPAPAGGCARTGTGRPGRRPGPRVRPAPRPGRVRGDRPPAWAD